MNMNIRTQLPFINIFWIRGKLLMKKFHIESLIYFSNDKIDSDISRDCGSPNSLTLLALLLALTFSSRTTVGRLTKRLPLLLLCNRSWSAHEFNRIITAAFNFFHEVTLYRRIKGKIFSLTFVLLVPLFVLFDGLLFLIFELRYTVQWTNEHGPMV